SIEDSESYLRNLAIKGLNKRLEGKVTDEYKKRLNYELDVISNMGFTDYFLIVLDYVRFAIKNDIFVGAGRGSAAGSLVAYSLGITWIDPLKYDLLFERFLNPERVTMPDIDIDFEYERREEVIDYVKNRYGESYVSKIMTFVTMTAKEVIRCVGKINDVDESTLNSLLKYINSKESLKNNLTDQVKNVLKRNSLLNKIYSESMYLEGIKKTIGTHPAGLVVSSKELDSIIPIIKSGDDYLTGLTMNELEDMGLIKMDFLAIRNLTILTNVLKDIENIYGRKLNINTIPLDDKKVYDLFSRADTVGVFQFESTGLMNFLRRLKPTKFDDLVMALAIYRPGPMQNIDLYIDCKNNGKKVEYIDESLKPILESTYGILIYQEQIMEILRFMASYSYAEADIIRRAISKR
ncbi:MAG: DNA polymerase III subunit alpha, partial [Bacilli bacterium]|nr:DNA polymerase III subunit alpha [Bacilli bacterium]